VAQRRFVSERLCGALAKRSNVHREDLLSPDLVSEIVLLGFGTLILVSILLFVVTALPRA
jgi:hypothetical protein